MDALVCLFEECDEYEILYSHSRDWLQHMRRRTRRWQCSAKSHGTRIFGTRKDFDHHFAQDHKRQYGSAQLDLLAERGARSSAAIFEGCPLRCHEIVPADGPHSLTDHVVGHLRSLALKSLPPHYEDGEDVTSDEDARSSSGSGNTRKQVLKNNENSLTFPVSSSQIARQAPVEAAERFPPPTLVLAGVQQPSGVDQSPPDSSDPPKEANAQDGLRDTVQAKAVAAVI